MPFEKNHKYRWEPENEIPLDKHPICLKGRTGQKQALRDIPDWQNKRLDYIDELINKKPS
ncbi:MAG: hypothetical protein RLZZ338_4088 [Cyanobacteriota bacterium]|jgi:hypothetical protein